MGFEELEVRKMLSTMDWTNASGGSWDVATNWTNATDSSDHHVPTASDSVMIPELGSGVSITHSADTDAVESVTSSTNLILTGGSLQITGNLQMSAGAELILEGGTLESATVTSGSTLALTESGGNLAAA